MARGVLIRTSLQGQPRAELLAELPGPLGRLVLDPPMDSDWVPEMHFIALNHAIADYHRMSDAEVLTWVRERNRVLFASPSFRLLIAVLSPEMFLRLVSARWGALHRGTTLELLRVGRGEARLELRFPLRLFDAPAVRIYAEALATALEHSRAREPHVTLESTGEEVAGLLARWG